MKCKPPAMTIKFTPSIFVLPLSRRALQPAGSPPPPLTSLSGSLCAWRAASMTMGTASMATAHDTTRPFMSSPPYDGGCINYAASATQARSAPHLLPGVPPLGCYYGELSPYMSVVRVHKTVGVKVGGARGVLIGGGAPVV